MWAAFGVLAMADRSALGGQSEERVRYRAKRAAKGRLVGKAGGEDERALDRCHRVFCARPGEARGNPCFRRQPLEHADPQEEGAAQRALKTPARAAGDEIADDAGLLAAGVNGVERP